MILSLATTGFLACESEDKVIETVFNEVTRGAVFRSTTDPTEVANQEFPYSDPSSTYSVTFEVEDNAQGALLQDVEVYTTYYDEPTDTSSDEVLITTLPASAFSTNANGLPAITVTLTLEELATAVGIAPADYFGGDNFTIRYVLNLTDGRTFSSNNLNSTVSGGSYYRSPFKYIVPLVCPPVPPVAGEWTLNLADSYGDGWNGASLVVTMDGTETGSYTLDDGAAISYTFVVPEGIDDLTITYVSGAYDSEVSFEIISGQGNVKADVSPSPIAGPVVQNYCVD